MEVMTLLDTKTKFCMQCFNIWLNSTAYILVSYMWNGLWCVLQEGLNATELFLNATQNMTVFINWWISIPKGVQKVFSKGGGVVYLKTFFFYKM
jgi:hypothetical protein